MGNMQRSGDVPVVEARAAVLDGTRADIVKFGWSVIGVFPASGDPGVSFSYTVGLSGKGLPELAIYGLPVRVGHQVLNAVARQMVDAGAALVTGQRIENLLEVGVPLVAVVMTNTRDLNLVREVYGSVVSAVQVCWPDVDGLLPWEQGSSLSDMEQPVYGVAPTGRAVYRARRLPVETAGELAELVGADTVPGSLSIVDPQADNDRRAMWGARALLGYATWLGKGTLETTASDMLADLRHLFDALGLDWEDAMSSVERNYRAEILGEL
ncbi:DUF4262 domain-containing protein [Candidatus Mycobacterium methanotrophicum]|uniref:DUF4262 domain-containing protein n=1 Tax=Candidatus Mycobacterium methanotrophicum TaxID=2943498 RepID=A0ABY4QSP9_9MYCO|nr:DUF4262 domain-containing protein [Candidatus Mycobacterium methanotrophicum]UQX13402.1 DUF4262 domain-containing protein [Candidatus Mycobacterium methanotrophicum]